MKKLLPLLLIVAFASCEEKKVESQEEPQPFTFSTEVDTIQIDFKDRFYFMEFSLATSTVSPDKKILYNLNLFAPNLEIIDLDKLELIKIEPMDKEGPSGIGSLVHPPRISIKGEFLLRGLHDIRVLDSTRTQMKIIKTDATNLSGEVLEPDERFDYSGLFLEEGSQYVTVYLKEAGMHQGEMKGLALVDFEDTRIRKIPIPELNKINEFILKEQRFGVEYGEKTLLSNFGNNIIVSTSAFNEAFVYDFQKDTLFHKEFDSQLTSDSKKGNFPREFSTEEERKDLFKERSKEVEFGKFLYDEQNEKFWRFSYEMDRMIGDSLALKTVLTIFDSDLNQLHEEKVTFDYSFYQSFFKEGMLYSYINLNDEMAFVRVKPTYNP